MEYQASENDFEFLDDVDVLDHPGEDDVDYFGELSERLGFEF